MIDAATIAASVARSKMATEIRRHKAPAQTAAALRALLLVATDLGAMLRHEIPGFDARQFMTDCGFRGEGFF